MRNRTEKNAFATVGCGSSRGPDKTGRSAAGRLTLLSVLLLTAATNVATAKSLYVIAEIINYDRKIPIHAYDIAPDGRLTFQKAYIIDAEAAGVIGLAADSDTEHLFITYEGSGLIGLLDPTTLVSEGVVTAPGARDLAGIVYDHEKKLLYCVDRGTPNLYVYQWDSVNLELTPVMGSPFMLEGAQAYGIALDEVTDMLYVGGPESVVRVYSTADWRLIKTIEVSAAAISVAFDPARQFLYYGGGYVGNLRLTRVDLASGSERHAMIGTDAGVIGLGVDVATGLVYVTTGQNQWGGGDDLLVFSSNLVLVQSIQDIGNPTGLVIPSGHLSYNPLQLAKTIEGPGKDETGRTALQYATIGEEITYNICFNHDALQLTNVTAVDRLPAELTFVSATGDGRFGQYDPATHTYTWQNPPLSPDTRTCLELVGQIKRDTPPGRIIRNWVTLDTHEMPPTTTGVEVVATEGSVSGPLNVSKTVIVKGVEAVPPAYVTPGEQITYRISLDNKRNQEPVADVLLIDELPDEVEFVSATGDGVFGRYEPITHAYVWSYPWLLAGESSTVDLVVRVKDGVTTGTTIRNSVTAEGAQTQPSGATVDVIVSPASLRLNKTIVGGQPGPDGRIVVSPGDRITYALEFTNPVGAKPVAGVTIVDTLPAEVSFVSATGDRDFGSYDAKTHTFTWSLPPLAAGEQGRLELVVEVKQGVETGAVISNNAAIRSEQTPAVRVRADVVVGGPPQPSGPTWAMVYIRPTTLYRSDPQATTSVMVVVRLPEGFGVELIADTPLVLTPGNVRPMTQQIFGTSEQGKVMAFFDPAAILRAISGLGSFPVQITGTFRDGSTFTGNDVLHILQRP